MLGKALIQSASGSASESTLYVDDVFSTYTYTGNGSTQTITNGIDLAGEGGLVWIKGREGSYPNYFFDTARGANNAIWSNDTSAQTTVSGVTAFGSSGFTLGSDYRCNSSTAAYDSFVSWTFRKAPKFFDVVTYTGDGNNGRPITHSLGTDPGFIVIKRTDGTIGDLRDNWIVYHRSLPTNGLADQLYLNTTAAVTNSSSNMVSAVTSSKFDVNAWCNITSATYVAYLFAHDTSADGIIQAGSYTGNGSTNNSITLGWEPQYVMIKRATVSNGGWEVFDTMRTLDYGVTKVIYANTSNAEVTRAQNRIVVTATGFRITYATDDEINLSGSDYIYLAIRRPNKPPTSGTEVYNAIARTGTGAAATVTGVGFAPDAVLPRARTLARPTTWVDRLRGSNARLYSDRTNAEDTGGTNAAITLGMDGATYGADSEGLIGQVSNGNTYTYINHFFRRASGFFDVVCYTGTGVARTVNHNLGAVPELMIVKSRSAIEHWGVYHQYLGPDKPILLNGQGESLTYNGYWNSINPTSSVFTIGVHGSVNASSATYVAYLFATKPGISKVGSYTGNGSSQTINCGFSTGSRFILIKRTDSTGDWFVWDSTRGILAANDPHLSLNTTAAEVTTDDSVDPDNSGFIVNQVAATNINVSSATYIFLAVA